MGSNQREIILIREITSIDKKRSASKYFDEQKMFASAEL